MREDEFNPKGLGQKGSTENVDIDPIIANMMELERHRAALRVADRIRDENIRAFGALLPHI